MTEKNSSTEIFERLLMEDLSELDAAIKAGLIKSLTRELLLTERGKICKAMKEKDNFLKFDNGWTYKQEVKTQGCQGTGAMENYKWIDVACTVSKKGKKKV